MTSPSIPKTASSAFLLAMADHATTLGTSVSLHTSDPQDIGLAEVSGGKYARATTTWAAAVITNGVATALGSDCIFNVPANTACTHFGVWGASGFLYGAALVPPVNVGSGGDGMAIVSPRYEEVTDATLLPATGGGVVAPTVLGVSNTGPVDGGSP